MTLMCANTAGAILRRFLLRLRLPNSRGARRLKAFRRSTVE
jgi:hypothetical protein